MVLEPSEKGNNGEHDPLPPKKEQGTPETRTPTGAETGAPPTANGQQGAELTGPETGPVTNEDLSAELTRLTAEVAALREQLSTAKQT